MKQRAMRRQRYRNPARLDWMGVMARDAGDLAAVHRLFKAAVRMGHARRVGELALSFDTDWAGRDLVQARHWYHRSLAVDRQYIAAHNLALLYRDLGHAKAHRRYLKLAFQRGDNDAALDLARLAQADGDLALTKRLLQHCLNCTPYDTITADSREAAAELLHQIDWS